MIDGESYISTGTYNKPGCVPLSISHLCGPDIPILVDFVQYEVEYCRVHNPLLVGLTVFSLLLFPCVKDLWTFPMVYEAEPGPEWL
jgi:hypothetical protein